VEEEEATAPDSLFIGPVKSFFSLFFSKTKRQQSSFLPEPLVFIIDDSAIVKRGRCDRRRTANPDAGTGLQATAMNHPASGPNGSEARRGSAGRLRLKHRILTVD